MVYHDCVENKLPGKPIFSFEVRKDDGNYFFVIDDEVGEEMLIDDVVVAICDMDLLDKIEDAVYTTAK